jgi:hypothetical protein
VEINPVWLNLGGVAIALLVVGWRFSAYLEGRIDGKLERLEGRIESRLDRLGDRLSDLEKGQVRLEVRLDKLEGRMENVERRMDKIEAKLDAGPGGMAAFMAAAVKQFTLPLPGMQPLPSQDDDPGS